MRHHQRFCFLSVAILLLQFGCRSSYIDTQQVRQQCVRETSLDFYFPNVLFETARRDLDSFKQAWYSEPLFASDEPSLSCGQRPDAYRFMLIPSFQTPVVVRVDLNDDGTAILTASKFVRSIGQTSLKKGASIHRQLSEREVDSLLQLIDDWDFWTISAADTNHGLDGAQWVFEGRSAMNYKVVSRWSPNDVPEQRLGLAFLSLTGW